MIDYQDLPNTVEERGNMGGIWQEVYFASKSDFASFATTPSESGDRDFATMNKLVVGKDELKPGKRLYTLYSTLEKGGLTAERQGEVDGMSHKLNLKLFTPGLESESLAMLRIPNKNWIFYVRTGEKMFRFGGPQFAAKLAAEGSVGTGDTTASAKGNELNFTTYELGYAPEVVDIDAILAMAQAGTSNSNSSFTVSFLPPNGAENVKRNSALVFLLTDRFIDSKTKSAFTNTSIKQIIIFEALDSDLKKTGDVAFSASFEDYVISFAASSQLSTSSYYRVALDKSRILSASTQKQLAGAVETIFKTAAS